MQNKELISVIIPVYNVENTLEKCVLSVINQTINNIEIILVDDGSTDCSSQICDEFKKKDNRIIVIHKNNGGLSSARNSGLDLAKGELIAFVDSDDYINNDYLETLYNLQKEHDADIVSCNFKKYTANKEIIESLNRKNNYEIIIRKNEECIKEYLDRKTEIKIYHCVWNKLYRRELFDNVRFAIGRYHEDLYITYQLLNKCKCLVAINLPLYNYNKGNGNSICTIYGSKHFIDQCDAMYEIYNSLKDNLNVKKELAYFIVNNAVDIYLMGFSINDDNLLACKHRLKKLILECTKNIDFIDRFKVYIKLIVPRYFINN